MGPFREAGVAGEAWSENRLDLFSRSETYSRGDAYVERVVQGSLEKNETQLTS